MKNFDGCCKCSVSPHPVKHIKWYKTALSQICLAWHVEKRSGGWPHCQLGTICLLSLRDYNQLCSVKLSVKAIFHHRILKWQDDLFLYNTLDIVREVRQRLEFHFSSWFNIRWKTTRNFRMRNQLGFLRLGTSLKVNLLISTVCVWTLFSFFVPDMNLFLTWLLILRNCKHYIASISWHAPTALPLHLSLQEEEPHVREAGLRGKLLNIMTQHLKGFEWHERAADPSFCKHRFSRGLDLWTD